MFLGTIKHHGQRCIPLSNHLIPPEQSAAAGHSTSCSLLFEVVIQLRHKQLFSSSTLRRDRYLKPFLEQAYASLEDSIDTLATYNRQVSQSFVTSSEHSRKPTPRDVHPGRYTSWQRQGQCKSFAMVSQMKIKTATRPSSHCMILLQAIRLNIILPASKTHTAPLLITRYESIQLYRKKNKLFELWQVFAC